MLECRHLAVSYGRHQALGGVDLRVAPGEIVVILGANGAGKTTLLKAVAGMVHTEGASQVLLDGQAITAQPPHRIVEAGLALVPEGRGIFGELSVRENLLLGAFAQRAREGEQQRLDRVLALFPRLAERSAQMARTMSGGEQQMVAIGRALMSAPTILMLDEPSLGLSPLLCSELFKNLAEVRKTGVGILLVEQNARQSLAIADRAYLLENGHIVGEGKASDLARDPAVQAAYLGGAAAVPVTNAGAAAVAGGAATPAGSAAPLSPGVAAALAAAQSVVAAHSGAAHSGAAAPGAAPAGRSTPAEALIPNRIADLVRHAAQVQARHVEEQRAAGEGTFAFAAGGSTPAGAHPAPGGGAGSGAWGAGASLSEQLARIEAAAAMARQAAPRPAHGAGGVSLPASPHAPAPAATPHSAAAATPALPAIEVWRRPTIEIWRRSADGSLQRGD